MAAAAQQQQPQQPQPQPQQPQQPQPQQPQPQPHQQPPAKLPLDSSEAHAAMKSFVLLKAFDVVSSGQYRKFVLRKKDLCEEWAMTMHDHYHMIMTEVRNLAKYPVLSRSQGHMEVGLVCAKLLNCVECPQSVTSGWNTCVITKVQCVGGVRVNSSSEATPVVVHSRFLRFCLSYWYASRIEHVLRRIVRAKYNKAFCDEYTLAQVSAMIHADSDILGAVVENLMRALTHVHASMHALLCINNSRGSETLSNFAI